MTIWELFSVLLWGLRGGGVSYLWFKAQAKRPFILDSTGRDRFPALKFSWKSPLSTSRLAPEGESRVTPTRTKLLVHDQFWFGQNRDRVRLKAGAGSMAGFELAIEDNGGKGEFLFWEAELGAKEDLGRPVRAMRPMPFSR